MDPTSLILDIKEKEVATPTAPSFPQPRSTTTGFPEHKKRNKASAFKQKRQGILSEEQKSKVFLSSSNEPLTASSHDAQAAPTTSTPKAGTNEHDRIDRENSDLIASMSPKEIESARQELFNGLDPSILERLLKRANLDEAANDTHLHYTKPDSKSQEPQAVPEISIQDTEAEVDHAQAATEVQAEETSKPSPPPRPFAATVTDEADEPSAPSTTPKTTKPPNPPTATEDPTTATTAASSAPSTQPSTHASATDPAAEPAAPKPHFPVPPQPDDLDPADPNFLEALHRKYFPSLPADPSKLAWMAPVPTPGSVADRDSPYHPDQASLPVSALRFSFRGRLLPPRIARAVPATKGLHHHAEAPEAAGYTVAELARLCRSAVPGQRCIAYQTLGRLLYRLGRGEFGGPGAPVPDGIWGQVREGAVLRSLYEEAAAEEGRGHRSARVYAVEAIWLFEKGGWAERVKRAK
ncbi:RPAP1-like protein [Xylariomycetidae sp. FL0641]|nr:RPAP1-like protein [Xylariomycetidae sp. FL0641]